MTYDFVEIGAYFADTCVDTANQSTRGLLVEPIETYLERIPDFPLITKVPFAIVDEQTEEHPFLYYITQDDVKQHNLHDWIAQCNCIGRPHLWHLSYTEAWDHSGPSRDLTQLGIVRVKAVPCMTFKQLADKFDITAIIFLKIDAEGYDSRIINSMLDHTSILPKKIQFETNEMSNPITVQTALYRLTALGYTHVVDGQNTISTLQL